MELANNPVRRGIRWLLLTECALPARRPAERVRFRFSTVFLAISTPRRPILSTAAVSPPVHCTSTMTPQQAVATPALLQVKIASTAQPPTSVSPATFPLFSSTTDAK